MRKISLIGGGLLLAGAYIAYTAGQPLVLAGVIGILGAFFVILGLNGSES